MMSALAFNRAGRGSIGTSRQPRLRHRRCRDGGKDIDIGINALRPGTGRQTLPGEQYFKEKREMSGAHNENHSVYNRVALVLLAVFAAIAVVGVLQQFS